MKHKKRPAKKRPTTKKPSVLSRPDFTWITKDGAA